MPDLLQTACAIEPIWHVEDVTELIGALQERVDRIEQQAGAAAGDDPMPWLKINDEALALNNLWSYVSHLKHVIKVEAIDAIYDEALALIVAHSIRMAHHRGYYDYLCSLRRGEHFSGLTRGQQAAVRYELKELRSQGVHLSAGKKAELSAHFQALSKLSHTFTENLIQTQAEYEYLVTDRQLLAGVPEDVISQVQCEQGYRLTLAEPVYIAVMRYAENAEVRKKLYLDYVSRASGIGFKNEVYNNDQILVDIMSHRSQVAKLLKCPSYAHKQVKDYMAKDPEKVMSFLDEMHERVRDLAADEWQMLQQYARSEGLATVEPWDVAYISEKHRQSTLNIDTEALRAYFPLEHVLKGMFTLCRRLFNIRFQHLDDEAYHRDVMLFKVFERDQEIGMLCMDLFARPYKRSGAWMDSLRDRHVLQDQRCQLPVALLNCNFRPSEPVCLSHDELETLLHEMGHCLHHLLTKVDVATVSGINAVPWDGVEVPSQLLEQWCWHEEGIKLLSKHVDTGASLPQDVFERLLASKQHLAGLQTVRQLEFACFDMQLHQMSPAQWTLEQINDTLAAVRRKVAVVPIAPENRFPNSFSHIFAGGYAAGYYAYKWSEIIALDMFAYFCEHGILSGKQGRRLWQWLLSVGGRERFDRRIHGFLQREVSTEAWRQSLGDAS